LDCLLAVRNAVSQFAGLAPASHSS
jgi:hypothetical protein